MDQQANKERFWGGMKKDEFFWTVHVFVEKKKNLLKNQRTPLIIRKQKKHKLRKKIEWKKEKKNK